MQLSLQSTTPSLLTPALVREATLDSIEKLKTQSGEKLDSIEKVKTQSGEKLDSIEKVKTLSAEISSANPSQLQTDWKRGGKKKKTQCNERQ